MVSVSAAFEDFLTNSSIHGLRYIAAKGNHWTERLFWFICCVLCWYGAILLIVSSYDSYLNSPLSFVVSTTYLKWDTNFPSVSVCEFKNVNKSKQLAKEYFGDYFDLNKMGVMDEIAYFHPKTPFLERICKRKNSKRNVANCSGIDVAAVARKTRSSCKKTFGHCQWNDKEFGCCKYFLHLETELGVCYSINNKQTMSNAENETFINLMSNKSTGSGSLQFELKTPAQIYIHSSADIPNANTHETDEIVFESKLEEHHIVHLSVHETENMDGVQEVKPKKRKCQFPWEQHERFLKYYQQYSYSACVVECRMKVELEKCNCTSHLMPHLYSRQEVKNGKVCDIKGMSCITENYDLLMNLKAPWSHERKGLICPCISGCEDMQIDMIMKTRGYAGNPTKSIIELKLHNLPSEKYKRKVVRSKLDLVVSMGSAIALFVGASLLSFVEIIYYFTLHLCRRQQSQNLVPTVVRRHQRSSNPLFLVQHHHKTTLLRAPEGRCNF